MHPAFLFLVTDLYSNIAAHSEGRVRFEVSCINADKQIAHTAVNEHALILSNDTDFLIYHGHPGYMPLEELILPDQESGKALPSLFRVVAVIYQPENIAKSFQLPLSHLPLLASLSGNDYVHVALKRHLPSMAKEVCAVLQSSPQLTLEALIRRRIVTPQDRTIILASMAEYDLQLKKQAFGDDVEHLGWVNLRLIDVKLYRRFWCAPIPSEPAEASPWLMFRPLRCEFYRCIGVKEVTEFIRVGQQFLPQIVLVPDEADERVGTWMRDLRPTLDPEECIRTTYAQATRLLQVLGYIKDFCTAKSSAVWLLAVEHTLTACRLFNIEGLRFVSSLDIVALR